MRCAKRPVRAFRGGIARAEQKVYKSHDEQNRRYSRRNDYGFSQ